MKGAAILLLVIGAAMAYQYEEDYQECRGNYQSMRESCNYEPCSMSSCNMRGYTCRNNYCGGCHAFWYDNNNNYYHSCSNYFMDWDW